MELLDWAEIYRVSRKRRLPTEDEINVLQQACGRLPDGYREFVGEFGFGQLDGIHIILPEHVVEQTARLRQNLAEWRWAREEDGQPIVIPPRSVDDGVALGQTDWGDYYFCSPSDRGVLWYLWRPHDWDSNPSVIPLGFRNPFLHQEPGQEPMELGRENLVFDPYRDVYSYSAYISGTSLTADYSSDMSALADDLLCRIHPDRTVTDEYGVSVFLKKWGAKIRVGFRPSDAKYIMYASMDAEHENDWRDFLATLREGAYVFASAT